MSQSFLKSEALRDMIEHENLEEATTQAKKDFEGGADEVRITQPPRGVPCEDRPKPDSRIKPMVSNEELSDKIDALSNKINQIFGEAVLVNGKWIYINLKPVAQKS
jgi:hypothetical protein